MEFIARAVGRSSIAVAWYGCVAMLLLPNLATVADIVSQYRGDISVSSAPGAGTTFRILFPRA